VRIAVASLALFLLSPSSHGSTHDAYFGGTLGSSRVIGLGGAYRAAANDINAAILNPAGLSFMNSWWDAGLGLSSIQQSYQNPDPQLDWEQSELSNFFVGVAFKIEKWRDLGLGLAVYSPQKLQLSGSALSDSNQQERLHYLFEYFALSAPVSIRVVDGLSLGANFKYYEGTTEITFRDRNNTTEKQGVGRAAFDIGLLYQTHPTHRISLTHHFQTTLKFEDRETKTVDGFQPFREARIPHRTYLGNEVRLSDRWNLLFDIGLLYPVKNAIVPGSGLSSNVSEVKSGQKWGVPYHLGTEYLLKPRRWEGRVGHYYQPSRSNIEPHRFHLTGGLDYFFWYLKIGFAFDVAERFFNFGLNLSPSFAHRESR